jgi:hypothetical protein
MKALFTFLVLWPIFLKAQESSNNLLHAKAKYKFATQVTKPLLMDANFKLSPDMDASVLLMIPKGISVKLLGIYDGFYRVNYNDQLGFIHFVSIDGDYKTFVSQNIAPSGTRGFYDYENEPNDIVLFGKTSNESPLKYDPSYGSKTLYTIPANSIIKITHQNSNYWKTEINDVSGYVGKTYIIHTAKTYDGAQHISLPEARTTEELVKETDAILKKSNRIKAQESSQYYIRGPRGGCYYLTASGRKQYVDRGMCN